jgi:hypothetical protein
VLLFAAAMGAVAFLQWRRWVFTAAGFKDLMLFGLGITGLVFLPLRVMAEIGLGLLEAMQRQVRESSGERLVIRSAEELDGPPKPLGKDKKTPPVSGTPAAAQAEAPAGK